MSFRLHFSLTGLNCCACQRNVGPCLRWHWQHSTVTVCKLSSYGITGSFHLWLQNFLTQRQRCMKVIIEGKESHEVPAYSGIPQGTVLGPILFLCHIIINDLPKAVKSQVCLFADDCLLNRRINLQQDHQILQSDLNELEWWADTWGMHFNTNIFYILSTHNMSSHYYSLNNNILVLLQVDCSPYLGVTLTHDLRWKTHVSNITKKASSTPGSLRRNLQFCPPAAEKQPTSPLSTLL